MDGLSSATVPANGTIDIGNADFLRCVFFLLCTVGSSEDAVIWTTHMARGKTHWRGAPWDQTAGLDFTDESSYFCMSALKPNAKGQCVRQTGNFAGLYCVVLDDVGTGIWRVTPGTDRCVSCPHPMVERTALSFTSL